MPNSEEIRNLRKSYGIFALELDNMQANPFKQFEEWFEKAMKCEEIEEVNAMTLATCGKDLKPSLRTILLKGVKDEALVFYTNYDGKKAQQLAENKQASLLFFWPALERQVRIEGIVEKVSPEVSDSYFNSRPKGSKIGAIASAQSKKIDSREALEIEVKRLEEKYKDTDNIPRPKNWGGYFLKADYWEFWQGRPDRLHDRIAYEKKADNTWEISRLAP